MNAFEIAKAKSRQMSDLAEAIEPLDQDSEISLPIDETIVVTYLDIRRYLNTVSKSHKRYAVFLNEDKFTVIRVTDNLDLRSIYGDESMEPTPAATTKKPAKPTIPPKMAFSIDECELPKESLVKIKASTSNKDQPVNPPAKSTADWLNAQAANGWKEQTKKKPHEGLQRGAGEAYEGTNSEASANV